MRRAVKIIPIILLTSLMLPLGGIEKRGNEGKTKHPAVDSEAAFPVSLKIIRKPIETINDIEPVENRLVKPVDYTNVISLQGLPIELRKKKFIDLILPGILIARLEYKQELEKVRFLSGIDDLTREEQKYLDEMMRTFKAGDISDLEMRLMTHPTSIILAQASLESGWGTSRFFVEGSNLFGVWSFNKNEPRLQTTGKRNGEYIYVKKYGTISESIDDYLRTLARGKTYERFRQVRAHTDDPYEIIEALDEYCELRDEYVNRLRTQIALNELEQYDDYEINPAYFLMSR